MKVVKKKTWQLFYLIEKLIFIFVLYKMFYKKKLRNIKKTS